MADHTSHLWQLSDSQLLAYFNETYPQKLPWRLCHLSSVMKSALISACCSQHLMPELFLHVPLHKTTPGPSGEPSVRPLAPTMPSQTLMIPFSSSKSLPNATVMAASPPARGQSNLALWRTPSVQWPRASPDWGPLTLGKMPQGKSISASNDNSEATPMQIHLPIT
jgi:hypothetical protein